MYLAHVGCYLPCESCEPLPVLTSLLSKLTVHEDTANFQKSLFYSEISEITAILEAPSGNNSIWLIDDFAKTTSGINWEALNTTMGEVCTDRSLMSRIGSGRDGSLPFVFLTCTIEKHKAQEVFGGGATKVFNINEDTFKVTDDSALASAHRSETKASSFLQELLQSSKIPLDPFIIERAGSIVTNLEKEP